MPTPFEKGVGSPKLKRQKRCLNNIVFESITASSEQTIAATQAISATLTATIKRTIFPYKRSPPYLRRVVRERFGTHVLTTITIFTAVSERTTTAHKQPPQHLRLSSSERFSPQAPTAIFAAGSEQTITAHHPWRRANPVLSDLRTGLPPQSRLRDEKRSEHLMRKSRFSKTPSETAEPFFFFLFPSGFSCFFFCERRNKRNETKKHLRK